MLNKLNLCKYCKNKITTLDGNRLYNDRCKVFPKNNEINKNRNTISYYLAFEARQDENKCGKTGKYFIDKYLT
jgi:hypothetical protein